MKKGSDPVLLDVGVLIALGWPTHPFHGLVIHRMEAQDGPWFTCALTQLGFIRLSTNPAVVNVSVRASLAVDLLVRMTHDKHHKFLSEAIPVQASATVAAFQNVVGTQQVTDAYLLALSASGGAKFLTLDTRLEKLAAGVAEVEILRLP